MSVTEVLEKAVGDGEQVRTFAYCERRLKSSEFAEAAAVLTSRRLLIIQMDDGEYAVASEAPRAECGVVNSKTRDDGSILAVLKVGTGKALLYFPASWSEEADRILVSLQWGDHPDGAGVSGSEKAEKPPDREPVRPADDGVASEIDTFSIVQELSGLSSENPESDE
jgi:hypothetical protein